MSCGTLPCAKVQAIVDHWMNAHPEMEGIWDVSDTARGFDVMITVGTKRITFEGLQSFNTGRLPAKVENDIHDWLTNLADRPTLTTIAQY